MSTTNAKVFLYKVQISRSSPIEKEFVIYHSSERRISKVRLTRIMEELLHSPKSGYKVSKITEVKLVP